MPITTPKEPTLIVFGGSFDPPHVGHIGCVQQAMRRFPQAQVWILPTAAPPAINGQLKAVASSFDHRLAMAQLAFSPLGSRVQVLTVERDLPRPNYTVNTLRFLIDQYPHERLGFLLGQDQWSALPRWHEPMQVLQLADLIIVARRGARALEVETIQTAQSLGLELYWHSLGSCATLGTTAHQAFFIIEPVSAAASSELRLTMVHQPLHHSMLEWLPPAVATYIDDHQLYSSLKDHL